jgi:hypothetical protein
MRVFDMTATAALMFLSTVGACGRPSIKDKKPEPSSMGSDVAEVYHTAKAQPGVHRLGADERRVKLLVLPADAAVEVDGLPVRRRDGVIELSGKVGQTHQVRLSRDAQHAETTVTVKDAGASPPSLDLAALVREAHPLGRGRLLTASTTEPAAAEPAVSVTPETTATAEPALESTLPAAMQDPARASEYPPCACPPTKQVVIYKCPTDDTAAARGKEPRGVLGGDFFE